MLLAIINDIPDPGGMEDRRDGNREAVGRPSTLRKEDSIAQDVAIEDLSISGFSFRSPLSFPVGTLVQVGLSSAGVAKARVVRSDGHIHGCAFLQPLTQGQFEEALAISVVLEAPFPKTFKEDLPYPEFTRWPRPVRIALLAIGLVGSWAIVFALVAASRG